MCDHMLVKPREEEEGKKVSKQITFQMKKEEEK